MKNTPTPGEPPSDKGRKPGVAVLMGFISLALLLGIVSLMLKGAPSMTPAASFSELPPGAARAIFAGGCFWCTEAEFKSTEGVLSVISGYTGGTVANPSYEQVGSGRTGHAEAVEVIYDPQRVTYDKLLDIYWGNIDPTDKGGQFYDRGTQYRTVIYYVDEAQKAKAEASLAAMKVKIKEKFGVDVATTVEPAHAFYAAEEYHQDYSDKNPVRYNAYKYGSGRVEKLKEIWGDKKGGE